MRPPLFLVGAQRSGTTALAHAISGQSHLQSGGRFTVNGKLWYLILRWLGAGDLAARHFRADEISYALRRRPAQGAIADSWLSEVDHALRVLAGGVARGAYPSTRAGVLAARRDLAASVAGDRPWGDKYNEYLLDLPELHETFPSAQWIFLSRAPSEVVASMLAWNGDRPWNPNAASDAEAKWIEWNSRWLAFRERLAPAQALEIDYADLCSGAAHAQVARFTGLDLSTALRGYHRQTASSDGPAVSARAQDVWAALRTSP